MNQCEKIGKPHTEFQKSLELVEIVFLKAIAESFYSFDPSY